MNERDERSTEVEAILDRVGVSPRNKKRIWNKNSHGGLIEEDWPEVIRPGTGRCREM